MNQAISSSFGALLATSILLFGASTSAAEGEIETVVVTGSRIAHSPTDGPQPLTVVSRLEIDASGLLVHR